MPQLGIQELMVISAISCLTFLIPVVLLVGLFVGIRLLYRRIDVLEQHVQQLQEWLKESASSSKFEDDS